MNANDVNFSELEAFADSARAWLASRGTHERLRQNAGHPPRLDRAIWKEICEQGWPAVLVAEADGGLGLDLPFAAAIHEQVGRALLPEPLLAVVQAVNVLARLPRSTLRDRLLQEALSGECVPGLAWQENNALAPQASCDTVVVREAERVRVRGKKQFATPGASADGWIVSAGETDDPASPVLVWIPNGSPGVHCESQPRADGSCMATLVFDDVAIETHQALVASGEHAFNALSDAIEVARLLEAAELLGVARHTFEVTLEYLKTRTQFGRPIGANQALQHRAVDALLYIELAAADLRVCLHENTNDRAQLRVAASRAKARCAQAALHVTREAVQFHGAMGYTDECEVGLYLKRALHLAAWLGNADGHRMRVLDTDVAKAHRTGDHQEATGTTHTPEQSGLHAMDETTFRNAVRRFFEQHYPAELRHVPRRLHWPDIKSWYMTLSRHGWLAPSWPAEYGGMGLPVDKLVAFIEEQEAYGVARMPDQGLINLGPMLIAHGSDEQKRRWLPPILAGEHIWCQGYSEPNAGSDLASLRTEAILDGDHFVVNGQKIWSTLAQDATHMFMLARTGKFARKQEGISFLLLDLRTPGVTVRPIRTIAGEEEFCEVFFDNVRVAADNLVGTLHQGWALAKSLLGHERIFIGSPKTCEYAMAQLRALARARGLERDAVFQDRLATLHVDVLALRALYGHFADIVKRGHDLPPTVSLLKVWASETYGRISSALIDLAGDDGAAWGAWKIGDLEIAPLAPFMNSLATTIYGGTNEIQRNIVARQVLELPA